MFVFLILRFIDAKIHYTLSQDEINSDLEKVRAEIQASTTSTRSRGKH